MSFLSRRYYFVLIFPLCLTAACSRQEVRAGGTDPPQGLPVKVRLISAQKVGESTEYLATLKSRSGSVLQPQVDGQITRIFVRSGDRVETGAPLLEIDPLKQQATVNNQEANHRLKVANLDMAEKNLERYKNLAKDGVVSKQALDQAQSAYDAAKADVDAMEAGIREQQVQLRYYTVRAPAPGTLGDIPVRVGDRVKPDTVLTTLDRGSELEAYISVPAEKSALVRQGMPVELIGDDGQVMTRTTASFISPRVDSATQLLLIKAIIPNQDHRFRNEQIVHARVVWQQVDRPLIPVTAVSRVSGQMFAFVVDDSGKPVVARQRGILLGDIVGNDYVVLNGVKPGDRVIISGVEMLADGMPVKPMQ